MSPDSSEDSKSSDLGVKREKIMYTCPHKLKKMKDIPDCVNFINDSAASENPFVGQVDGRLNPTSSDKYNAITQNFNLYEIPDDSLSDNNVSSSNGAIENSDYTGIHSKTKSDTTVPSKANQCVLPRKKKVVLSEEVSTSDERKPQFPVNVPNGVPKSIIKTRNLYVALEKLSQEKIDNLVSVNEISTGIADMPFPQFSFVACHFQPEKYDIEKNNVSTNDVNFRKWRDSKNAKEHSVKGKLKKLRREKSYRIFICTFT